MTSMAPLRAKEVSPLPCAARKTGVSSSGLRLAGALNGQVDSLAGMGGNPDLVQNLPAGRGRTDVAAVNGRDDIARTQTRLLRWTVLPHALHDDSARRRIGVHPNFDREDDALVVHPTHAVHDRGRGKQDRQRHQ